MGVRDDQSPSCDILLAKRLEVELGNLNFIRCMWKDFPRVCEWTFGLMIALYYKTILHHFDFLKYPVIDKSHFQSVSG